MSLGIKYKFSAAQKSCKDCKRFPCITNQHKLKLDFARLGCVDYNKQDNVSKE